MLSSVDSSGNAARGAVTGAGVALVLAAAAEAPLVVVAASVADLSSVVDFTFSAASEEGAVAVDVSSVVGAVFFSSSAMVDVT